MQIVNVEQGTTEWLEARLGIITMSRAQCLLVNGKGPNGLGTDAITYMFQLIAERFTGEIGDNFAGNVHTERGHALEPIARELYTNATGNAVEETGIILNHGVGYSPDGLVGDSGLIEIKTKLPGKMAAMLYDGTVPKEHMAQIQGGLWVSEREWLDFIGYWSGMPLFVQRVNRDEKVIKALADGVRRFYDEMAQREQQIIEHAA